MKTWTGICLVVALALTACKPTPAQRKHAAEAAKQARLQWNVKTLVDAYQTAGHSDPKWDGPAKVALTEFARTLSKNLDANEDWSAIISNNCIAAVDAGCDDPVIHYLWIRFNGNAFDTKEKYADALCQTAKDIDQSSYPEIRKYYIWLRSGQEVISTFGYGTNVPRKYSSLGIWQAAINHFKALLDDKTTPPEEIAAAAEPLLETWKASPNYNELTAAIEQKVTDSRAKAPSMLTLQGIIEIGRAWQARGSGYSGTVQPEGWKQFSDHLAKAENILNEAWKLDPENPEIPLNMMTVELGQGKGRDNMELWFGRAMKLDPNYYNACYSKLMYLEPKWYGSVNDMLDFGRECVTNPAWGGHVPLILMDAHQAIESQFTDASSQSNYWSRPEVWVDLKSAFDRFFELNPDATGWYYNYAWYAYTARQWNEFTTTVPKLGKINFAFFGGQENFEKMVAYARAQSSHRQTKD